MLLINVVYLNSENNRLTEKTWIFMGSIIWK